MIYLVRHGLDDERYIGGWSNVDLVKEGTIQIEKAAKFMINNHLEIKHIYSSDIFRAITSSKIIQKHISVPITYTSMLRELNKGLLNGLPLEEAQQLYPEFMSVKDIDLSYPEGESMSEFYKRIQKKLQDILHENQSLLVTHRGVINMIYLLLQKEELTMDKNRFQVDHGSIHEYNPLTKKIKRIY